MLFFDLRFSIDPFFNRNNENRQKFLDFQHRFQLLATELSQQRPSFLIIENIFGTFSRFHEI